MNYEMIDVTSSHRPDPTWKVVDKSGHLHQWFTEGKPADGYYCEKRYETPTLKRITDVEATDEYPAQTHFECAECGDHIEPRYTADTSRQYIRGLAY